MALPCITLLLKVRQGNDKHYFIVKREINRVYRSFLNLYDYILCSKISAILTTSKLYISCKAKHLCLMIVRVVFGNNI
jgi:hypothetical protein